MPETECEVCGIDPGMEWLFHWHCPNCGALGADGNLTHWNPDRAGWTCVPTEYERLELGDNSGATASGP